MAFLSPVPLTYKSFSTSDRTHTLCCHRRQALLPAITRSSLSPPPPSSDQQDTENQLPQPTVISPTGARAQTERLSNFQVVLERLGDTLTDVRIHYARQFFPKLASPKEENGLRIVVLGTGWGAHSLVKVVDVAEVQSVTVISPRNFFFFTPLLSATAVGTVEFRSIVEPIRKSNPLISYFEAVATKIDHEAKTVHCVRDPSEIEIIGGGVEERDATNNGNTANSKIEFDVPYDILVVAVGETTATFNVPGAREHAHFLKEITDARRLRTVLLGMSHTLVSTFQR